MAIRFDASGVVPSMIIEGELSIYTAAELKPQLYHLIQQHSDISLDLSEVSEFDGAGLQLLIAAKREAVTRGHALRLNHHSLAVLEVFDLCNMASFFGDPLIIPDRRYA
ncbi:STAS domain-containing protein [Arsukibacterium sp.]|uniref:STAS domain-containing protein n=1 Tax=Arsukibacterium sp. TaxID=1977258 RepID=UPI00299E6E85|nr:STAS domain-containing protein [Arsukibacterium sp.]MDX1678795.1 STAS domain-containing protein [Arsukibacterium sp.]